MFKDDDWVRVFTVLLIVVFFCLFGLTIIQEYQIKNLERTVEKQQIQIDYQRDVINNINRKVLYPGG